MMVIDSRGVVVVGGGHNGLVAAWYLAKAGLKPIVLERRGEVGGGAITGEVHPGFRAPTLTHDVHLHADIVRELDLRRHGVEWLTPDAELCVSNPDGEPLVLHRDAARGAEALRRFSAKDADAWPAFRASTAAIAGVLNAVFEGPPPSIDAPTARDLLALLTAGRRFRALGRRDEFRMLRWLPMPAADFAEEWFEGSLLRAAVCGAGVSGTMLGPYSAGSTLVLMMRLAHRLKAGPSSQVRGGPGALTQALAAAAREAGAEIRTGVAVERLLVRDGRVAGVVADGIEIPAAAVLSTADPKTTLLGLTDPLDLDPDFAAKIGNYRAHGTMAKMNLALSALPRFGGASTDPAMLGGHLHLGPEVDYIERAFDHAKYGEYSSEPWLDVTIPSILDPTLAPAGAHVMSIYVHYAPYRLREGQWDTRRDALLRATMAVLERHAPGIGQLTLAAQVITPADLERDYGFSGGHIFHGELAPDQLFTMRPLLGYGRYDTPIGGLFLGGAGTHPGGFLTGLSGRLAARQVVTATR